MFAKRSIFRIVSVLSILIFTLALAVPVDATETSPAKPMKAAEALSLMQYTSSGHVLGFTSQSMYIGTGSHALRVDFVDANIVTPLSVDSDTPSNGTPKGLADPPPHLTTISYANLWDGVTLTYDSTGIVRSTYLLEPYADLDTIRLRYNRPILVQSDGSLRIEFETRVMTETSPTAWQVINDRYFPVDVSFKLLGESEIGFLIDNYDPAHPLFIDPTLNWLSWNTFLGSSEDDQLGGIAVDHSGNIYVTGRSYASWGSPITPYSGGEDAFIAKLDPNGVLLWNTFMGSNTSDTASGIVVDASGNVYVTGQSNFQWHWSLPVNSYFAGMDAFAAKFDTNGIRKWHTFMGSGGNDYGFDIAVDTNQNVYVTGRSYASWGSPVIPYSGGGDAFITKLDSDGVLKWNTFLGSANGDEYGWAVDVDALGSVYVTGPGFFNWGGPVNPPTGSRDFFVAKLDTDGALQWNTFLGSSGTDQSYGIALDSQRNVYVTGMSFASWGAPISPYQSGDSDAFIAKLNINGALDWNTFLGSSNFDGGYGVSVDSAGGIYITGESHANWGSPANTYAGGGDAFVSQMNSNGTQRWNTFLGSSNFESGSAITVDSGGNVYVAGFSGSSWGMPINPYVGRSDISVAKLDFSPSVTIEQSAGQLDPAADSQIRFTAIFTEPIKLSTFTEEDIILGGTVGTATVSISEISPHNGTTFDITVSSMSNLSGTVSVSLAAGVVEDLTGNTNNASTSNDNQVAYDTAFPAVLSIVCASPNPTTAPSVNFTLTFSEPVTGVDSGDFALTTTDITGASITGVSGSAEIYTVTVNTGSGDGAIRLDVNDDDSIVDGSSNSLGGVGTGNGNFIGGETYLVDKIIFTPGDGKPATLVLGQADFLSGFSALSQSSMSSPTDVAIDPVTGKVFVAEYQNNRVLRFASASSLANGAAAEAVLGQPSFASSTASTTQNGMRQPYGLFVDSDGRLWVAEYGSNRVLRFDNASVKTNGANADGVLGQPNFTSNTSAYNPATQNGMASPVDVVVDSNGSLWVADYSNSRILRFNDAAAKPNGANADGVLGQANFATNTPTNNPPTQSGMFYPFGVAVDIEGRLWVADTANARILRFDNAASKPNGANADGVLGQPNFTSNAQAYNPTQSRIDYPYGVFIDDSGRLWITDTINNRILRFDDAAAKPNGANADGVLGQPDFTSDYSNYGGRSASTLSSPRRVFYDSITDRLWVADADNHRVLMYDDSMETVPPNILSIFAYDPLKDSTAYFYLNTSEAVTGLDPSDFSLTTIGVTGAQVTNVILSGSYIISVDTGVGNGTIHLDLIDDDSVIDWYGNPLGGLGAGNGDFTTSGIYTVDKVSVSSIVRADSNPTNAVDINFIVTFSESVYSGSVNPSDFILTTAGGIAGVSVSSVTGSGATYTVSVNTGTGDGTIRLDLIDDDSIIEDTNWNYSLGGSGAGNGNFTGGETYTIDKTPPMADQTIAVNTSAQANAIYGSSFTVVATVSSLLPVTYSSSGACTNVGGDFTMTSGTGTCMVIYDQAGNASYNPAPQVVEVVNAQQAVLTVTADAQAKVYGSPDPSFRFTYNGFVGGDLPGVVDTSPVCTVPEAHVNVGIYRIICSGGSDDDYRFQYIDNELAVIRKSLTITADDQGKAFGTLLTFAGTEFTTGGLIFSDTVTTVTLNSAGAPVSATVAGSPYPIIPSTAVGAGLNNYAITYVNGLLTVSPNILTITANDQNKTYGDVFTFAGIEFTVAGLQGSDTVTSATLTSAGASPSATVGTYTIVPSSAVGTGLDNYIIIYTNGQMDVNPRNLIVTPDDKTKVYGDLFTAFTGTITGVQPSDNITASYTSLGILASAAVGDYPIAVTLSDPNGMLGNYNVILNTGSLSITPRDLVVTPDDKIKVYGDVFTAFTGAVMGVQPSDNITVNYASMGALASATVGSYPITATLNDPANRLDNYTVTLNTGTLTVDPSVLIVTAEAKVITIGDPDPAFTIIYSGFAAGDTSVMIDTPPTCSVAGPHAAVGTYPIACSGGVDDNYDFNYVNGTLTIRSNVPDLLTPANAEQLFNSQPTFDWTDVYSALSYTIQISNNIGFTGTPTSNTIIDSTFTQPTSLPNNVTRYWRVRANLAGDPGPWSVIRSFVTARPPSTPTLASPANNSLTTDYTPLLNWNDSTIPAGTTFQRYELQIATNNVFTSPTIEDVSGVVTNSEYTPVADLDPNATYYWRVRAFNTLGQYSAWSGVRSFRTALLPPTLINPNDTAQLLSNRPIFDWADIPGVTGYRIQIANNIGFSPTLTNTVVTSSTYMPTADLPAGTTLYWRVQSNGTNGPSAWSTVQTLTTANPPSLPTLASPANNAKVSGPSPLFNWNDSTLPVGIDFDHYQIQIATDNGFVSIVHDNSLSGITNSQDGTAILASGTTYYWRVRAFNTLAQSSAWSTVRSVRIKFAGPTLTLPVTVSTVSSLLPTFVWDALNGAATYRIQVSKSGTFNTLVINQTGIASTNFTPTANLQSGTTYYWRVRVDTPTATYAIGDWSVVFTFTTP